MRVGRSMAIETLPKAVWYPKYLLKKTAPHSPNAPALGPSSPLFPFPSQDKIPLRNVPGSMLLLPTLRCAGRWDRR
jgi:hypothetical protein